MSPETLGQVVVAGLANGAFYALASLPFAAVLGLTRVLNLAHGELVVLGGYLGYAGVRSLGLPAVAVAPLAALALVPAGLAGRALVTRLREPIELNSLVLTFALSLLLQNAMLGVFTADYRLLATGPGLTAPGLLGLAPGRAAGAGIALAMLLGLHLLLVRTRWGTALRAASRDAEAAQLMGVDTERLGTWTFGVAAAVAGLAGVLFATFHYLQPAAGVDLTLLAITLAILRDVWAEAWRRAGGLVGLLLGGLLVGLTESLVTAWAGPSWRELVVALGLLAALVGRGPTLGRRGAHG
jgi:branched-chain amino acid transport system permease protein